MATDPICHMTVDEKTGPHTDYKGQTYYFCSKHCLAKFEEDSARYVKPTVPEHAKGAEQPRTKNEIAAIDPVCGMTVDPKIRCGQHEHKGQTYYFCSQDCLAKFKQDPEKWLSAQHGGHAVHMQAAPQTSTTNKPEDAVYVCPMHPEVRQTGPGACPKCGMALEPAAPSVPLTKTEYVCPMHPEIVRDEPGACPICGMALEPRTVSWRTNQSRVGRHDPALLDQRVPFACRCSSLAMSDMLPGQPLQRLASPRLLELDSVRARHAGGALGRLAVSSSAAGDRS